MSLKSAGPGFYEFLIEAELQQYYNPFKNDLKVQNVAQLKYVSEDDMSQIGMSRPEMRRLTKYFHKHCPQTYLAKMKKKLLYRKDDSLNAGSLASNNPNIPGRSVRSVAPGRHIIQADAIIAHKTLGSGEFGTVQQGVWTSDDGERIQVAIKCLSQDRMENNPVEFLKEAAIMHTVDHENIVRLYGVVLDTSSLVLVTELAPLRSLLECLKEPSMRPNLTVQTLFDFTFQICDGMQYLESKRLIHRDLAARNILVFSRSKVKISDFGLSRALGVGKDYYQTNFNVNLKLPIAWCAPECINFLRFTSASDVWAFGVTIWEMMTYGFQPWAALTGQQILEAIDEPNYQRLERPESCPVEIYYQIMLKCWQHEPQNRPTFAQLLNLLPECKPEQVQAIREGDIRSRRDVLSFDVGDLITVIDKKPLLGNSGSGDESNVFWKGVLKCGKTGLFNPANTITYLGSSLPCVKENQGPFSRNDSRSSSMRKGRLSADMISGPQGDLKHTGHVGPDGNFFGDIAFMNSKCWVPRQVVPPYKPESSSSADASGCSTPSSRFHFGKSQDSQSENLSSDTAPLLQSHSNTQSKNSDSNLQRNRKKLVLPTNNGHGAHGPIDYDPDHEYHEISDEENEIMATSKASARDAIGLSNPALSSKSQSPLDSPRFEKSFDLGPSLMDEVFGALERDRNQGDDEANVKNELREMARHKKRFATVKPISSKDRKTLDGAIAMANELASRSMVELDQQGKHGGRHGSSFDDISPHTPTSPTQRKKFLFMIGSSKNNERERRNYSQETASIPDIQSSLSEEAKEAYNSLIDKPSSVGSLGFLTPSFENKSSSFHFPEKCSSKKSAFFDNEPLSPPPPASNSMFPIPSSSPTKSPAFVRSHTKSLSCSEDIKITQPQPSVSLDLEEEEEIDENPLRLLRKNKIPNVLPLPPRERRKFGSSRSFDGSSLATVSTNSTSTSLKAKHQRKFPLLIPGKVAMPSEESKPIEEIQKPPPPPPPKPMRHHINSQQKQIAQPETPRNSKEPEIINDNENSKETDNTLNNNIIISSTTTMTLTHGSKEHITETSKDEEVKEQNSDGIKVTESSMLDFNQRRRCFEIKTEEKINLEKKTENQSSQKIIVKDEITMTQNSAESKTMVQDQLSISKGIVGNPSVSTGNEETPVVVSQNPTNENNTTTEKKFRCSPSKDAVLFANPLKIKTVQRILGSSATERECIWALDICRDDVAHAAKLLRLKSLIPESLLHSDIERVFSVLEMSHWDVARASSFLLSTGNQNTKARTSLRKLRSEDSDLNYDNGNSRIRDGDLVNRNSIGGSGGGGGSGTSSDRSPSYIRPTRV